MLKSPEAVSALLSEADKTVHPSAALSPVVTRITDCLPTAPKELIKGWLAHPIIRTKASLTLFEPVLLNATSPGSLLSQIKEALAEQLLPLPNDNGQLSAILERAPREALIVLLSTISEVGTDPTVAETLLKLTKNSSDDSELNLAARWALARVNPGALDTTPLIREKIERWGNNEDHVASEDEMRAIKRLPIDGVLAQIQVGLRSGYAPIMIGAARVASTLGSTAQPVASTLHKLLKNSAPNVKYASALALLTIDPTGDDTVHAIERVLINRYFPDPHQAEFFATHVSVAPQIPLASLGEPAYSTP